MKISLLLMAVYATLFISFFPGKINGDPDLDLDKDMITKLLGALIQDDTKGTIRDSEETAKVQSISLDYSQCEGRSGRFSLLDERLADDLHWILSQYLPDEDTVVKIKCEAKYEPFQLQLVDCPISGNNLVSLETWLNWLGVRVTLSCFSSTGTGVVFTRWGNSVCPFGTSKLYDGKMGGALYREVGGSNYLCMPKEPSYGNGEVSTELKRSDNRIGRIFPTEYEYPTQGSHDHDASCAVCHASTRSAQVMVPADLHCPAGWIREYYGYLMGETDISNHHRSEYICVDKAQASVANSNQNTNGALLYQIAMNGQCTGFQCPGYDPKKTLLCAVCTK